MALSPGDLMLVGYDSDNNDVAIIATTDIPAGEVLYFTDDEWDGTQFIGNEQLIEWVVPAGGIPAGTVLTLDMSTNPGAADVILDSSGASTGTVDYLNGGGSLAGANEMLWIVQGTVDASGDLIPDNFVGVIANEATGGNTVTPNLTNTGLTTSNGAIIIDGDNDYMEFNGESTLPNPATQQEIIDAVSDLSNWDLGNGSGNNNPNGEFWDLDFPDVICFVSGTQIKTPLGNRPIEDLRIGDWIITADSGIQAIKWIGKKHLSKQQLEKYTHLQPVRIGKGSLGNGLPAQDLLVSPQHRMLLKSTKAHLMFGTSEVLASAKGLINGKKIRTYNPPTGVEYFHILFEKHEIIFANQTPSESFYPGEFALGSIEEAARAEVFELFPQLRSHEGLFGQTARVVLKPKETRLINTRLY